MKSRISKHSSVQPIVSSAEPIAKTRRLKFRAALTACAIVALAILIPGPASAQNYSVIHNFTGGSGGAAPLAGLVIDHAGNLYGTTYGGGKPSCPNDYGVGCGTVFQLKSSNGIFTTLFEFAGGNDAAGPAAPLLLAPSGVLYGDTLAGGGGNCAFFQVPGCGTVFSLMPPATPPRNIQDRWNDSVLHNFQQSGDGVVPTGTLAMDRSGNLYGAAAGGGSHSQGRVFELTYSDGVWSESVLHDFLGSDGSGPYGGVTLDAAGNLYGTTQNGGTGNNGTVFQLLTGSDWAENTLYKFTGESDGSSPAAGVIFDSSGNLYSATATAGSGGGGTAFELSSGSWAFDLLYGFTGASFCGPAGNLTFDQAGNLYGTTSCDGAHGRGSVFKLTPSMGTWIYTSLYALAFWDAAPDALVFPKGSYVYCVRIAPELPESASVLPRASARKLTAPLESVRANISSIPPVRIFAVGFPPRSSCTELAPSYNSFDEPHGREDRVPWVAFSFD